MEIIGTGFIALGAIMSFYQANQKKGFESGLLYLVGAALTGLLIADLAVQDPSTKEHVCRGGCVDLGPPEKLKVTEE